MAATLLQDLRPTSESAKLRFRCKFTASYYPLKRATATSCWRNSACGFYIRTLRSTPVRERASKRFIVFRSHLKGLYGGLHFLVSRSYTTICKNEVPAPRSRPTTVRQGNGGLYIPIEAGAPPTSQPPLAVG